MTADEILASIMGPTLLVAVAALGVAVLLTILLLALGLGVSGAASARTARIRTRRQATRIREGIEWGRAINEARGLDERLRFATMASAERAARRARSDLMARAIMRTAYPDLDHDRALDHG